MAFEGKLKVIVQKFEKKGFKNTKNAFQKWKAQIQIPKTIKAALDKEASDLKSL